MLTEQSFGQINQGTVAFQKEDELLPKTYLLQIKEACQRRQDFVQTTTTMTNRIKGICRRLSDGDKTKGLKLYKNMDVKTMATCQAFLDARELINVELKILDKLMLKQYYPELPAGFRQWVKDTRGLAEPSVLLMIGSIGNPSDYANPARIWKRMGLAVINGERQRKCADKEKALAHGYNPRRRALMYVVGENLIRARNPSYGDLYRTRKEYELKRELTKIHAHRRAMRVMVKQLLKDLWSKWYESVAKPNP